MIEDFIGEPEFPGPGRRLPLLRPDQLDEAQRAVYDAVTSGPRAARPEVFSVTDDEGRLLGPFNAMLYAPEVGLPLQELGAAVRFRTNLSGREREIATLVVARHCRSDYEWYAHERIARQAGLTEAELRAIRLGRVPVLADVRERIVHEAVWSLTNDRDLGDALFTEVVATLGRPGLVELVTLVGHYTALALHLRVFKTGAPEGQPAPEWLRD